MICNLKNICIFVAVSKPTKLDNIVNGWIFYVHLITYICKDTRLFKSHVGYPCNMNSFVGARNWEENGLSYFLIYKFHSTMPTKMKSASGKKHSNPQARTANENGSLLTDDNIIHLRNQFNTPEKYAKQVGCLWVLRKLVATSIEESANKAEHKLFPLFYTVNELIGSLLRDDVRFDSSGQASWKGGNQVITI